MKINFIYSNNFNETRDMHSKFDNAEIMMGIDAKEIIKKKNLILFYKDIERG